MFKLLDAKVQRYGYGYYIILPTAWVNHHDINKKDLLTVSVDDKHRLIIEKKGENDGKI